MSAIQEDLLALYKLAMVHNLSVKSVEHLLGYNSMTTGTSGEFHQAWICLTKPEAKLLHHSLSLDLSKM